MSMVKKVSTNNNLKVLFPNIVNEWNFNKNNLPPEHFLAFSHKKVWWKCLKGHEWVAEIRTRTKRNYGCPYCSGRLATSDNNITATDPFILTQWNDTKSPIFYKSGSHYKARWKCPKGHEWTATIKDRVKRKDNCPYCSGRRTSSDNNLFFMHPNLINEWNYEKNAIKPTEVTSKSKGELEIYNFVKLLLPNEEVISNIRSVISPKELDIYIPFKKFAIEYNGLYWHEEKINNNKKRLLEKSENCWTQGIHLYHVFEDEWRDKQDIVKSMIKHRLGMTDRKIYARKCEAKEIKDKKEMKEFFVKTHIAGNSPARSVFGLYYNEELVAAISFRIPIQKKYKQTGQKETIEILRFACALNTVVVGGFSKLFNLAKKWAKEQGYKKVLTYADLRFSSSKESVYQKNGFTFLGRTKGAGYWYSSGLKREFRFKYRAKPGKTENKVAEEAGVWKVYGSVHDIYEIIL